MYMLAPPVVMTVEGHAHMGIINRIASTLGLLEPDFGEATVGSILDMVYRRDPPNRGDRALLVAARAIPELALSVLRIAEAVSSQPIHHEQDGEPVEDSRTLQLLASPNPWMTGAQRRKLQSQYVDILGECIDIILPTDDRDDGVPFELYPIPPIDATREKDGEKLQWRIRTPDGGTWYVPDKMVLWRKEMSLEEPYGRGVGLGRVLEDEVEIIEYSAAFEKAEYYNHAMPSSIISLAGKNTDTLKAFKEKWLQRFRGPQKANTPLFDNAQTPPEITELSRSIRESQVLEGRRAHGDIIQQVYGIPPIYAGKVESANRANAYIQERIWGTQVVDPRTSDEAEFYTVRLMPLLDEEGTISVQSAAPQDFEQRLEAVKASPGSVTVNERRELAGLPPVEGGDVYVRPQKMVEVQAGAPEADVQQRDAGDDVDWDNVVVELKDYRTKQPVEADTIAAAIPLEGVDQTEAREYYREELEKTAGRAAAELGIDVEDDIGLALLDPAFTAFAEEQAGELIKGIDETTKSQVRDIVASGIRKGDNPLTTARELKKKFAQYDGPRSRDIARTEAVKTVEYGKQQTWSKSGLVPMREWVATFDTATRFAHGALHGQRVGVDDLFVNPETGGTAQYPGDFPSAEQSINCRCGTVPWIDESSPALEPFPDDILDTISPEEREMCEVRAKHVGRSVTDEAKRMAWWKAFDDTLTDAEEGMVTLMRARFARQLDDVLEAMERVFGIDTSDTEETA